MNPLLAILQLEQYKYRPDILPIVQYIQRPNSKLARTAQVNRAALSLAVCVSEYFPSSFSASTPEVE